MTVQGSPFWAFSLTIYGRDGVPEACLELQDKAGADVNVLLYLLWLARQGRALDDSDVAAIDEFVASWRRSVVRSLRKGRRFLREPQQGFDIQAVERLRKQIKKLELEAERLQQEALHARWSGREIGAAEAPSIAASVNLEAYERLLSVKFPTAACEEMIRASSSIVV